MYFGEDMAQGFHVYGFEWDETSMKFYVDNVLVKTINQSVDYRMMTLLGIYEKPEGGWTGSFDSIKVDTWYGQGQGITATFFC